MKPAMMKAQNNSFIWLLSLLFLVGCLNSFVPDASPPTVTPVTPSLTATQTPIPPTLTATTIPTSTATPEPTGCQKPPDDYARVDVNGWTVNQRTMSMLAHAQELYGGEIDLTGYAITQGSYHDNGAASFGTHLGGGAVDLSVMQYGTYTILWDDIPVMIHALRTAGFAAWFRDYGELYQDSAYHIHAIAIGDKELSSAAQEQLTGPSGYFHGFIGLPIETYGEPKPDQFGGPVICQWMIDLGYRDLR
jgi:hypothetical protein